MKVIFIHPTVENFNCGITITCYTYSIKNMLSLPLLKSTMFFPGFHGKKNAGAIHVFKYNFIFLHTFK